MRHLLWLAALLAAITVMVSAPAGFGAPSPCPNGYEQLSIIEAPQGTAVDAAGNNNGFFCQQLAPKKDASPKLVDDKIINIIKKP